MKSHYRFDCGSPNLSLNRSVLDRELSPLAARRSEEEWEGSCGPGPGHALRLGTSRGPVCARLLVAIHAKKSKEASP
jgi:hypothetical protein